MHRLFKYIVVLVVAMMISVMTKGTVRSSIRTSTRMFSITAPFRSLSLLSLLSSLSSAYTKGFEAPLAVSASAANFDDGPQSFSQYNVAVAFQPKDREEHNLFKKKHNKPSPALLSPTGEDNLFVSKESNDGSIAVGVADGVGGWSEAGYDSSAISRELCALLKGNFEQNNNLAPKEMLTQAFSQILQSPKVEIGGTTACVGILTADRKLKVANLGDSWCGLFRDYTLVQETNFQTHNFNTPYQLAKIPEHIVKQAEREGRRYIIDSPESADEYTWDLQRDDVVVFATDGVTDNVVPGDIENFLRDQLQDKKENLGDTAKLFVNEVVRVLRDLNFPSAFAQELSRLTGQKYLGGKEDDITVVMVRVK